MHLVARLGALHRDTPEFAASVVLRGQALFRGEWVFRTLLAQPYPPPLAEAVAGRAVESMYSLQHCKVCSDEWRSRVPPVSALHDLPVKIPPHNRIEWPANEASHHRSGGRMLGTVLARVKPSWWASFENH